ncbi:hypothetical protein QJS10_CPA03g00362 [Acorus calamus]|uniref:YABBY N-terminal domain-containing protein n=1 Tax=Acorus calamus TaxID=4465 RepID=A0AAV9FDF7_ACOCL|nr:hypothetical protein QJS10_CPA03g00362 [Acorus calamus]
MVTVRCGHCTDLFSVDMMRASFIPIKLLASLGDEEQKQEQLETELPKSNDGSSPHMINGDEGEDNMVLSMTPIVNKQRRYRGSRPCILTSLTRKLSAQLLKIGHIFLGFKIKEMKRAAAREVEKVATMVGDVDQVEGQLKSVFMKGRSLST